MVQGVSYDDTFIDVTRVNFVVGPVGSVGSVGSIASGDSGRSRADSTADVGHTDAAGGHRRQRQRKEERGVQSGIQTTDSSPPSALPSDLLNAASFAVGLRHRLSVQFGMRFSIGVGRAKLTSKLAGAVAKPNKGNLNKDFTKEK